MRDRVEPGADGVVAATGIRPADDPGRAARLQASAIHQLIRGGDAGPRLGERGLGVASLRLDREHAVAVVAAQGALVNQAIFREAALDHVAVGRAHAILLDVGLDDQPVAGLVLLAQLLTDRHHRHRDLVAQHHRLLADVTEDARVLLAQLNHFDVGKTEAAGIVADQDLIRTDGGQRCRDRRAVNAQVLQAGPVERPNAIRSRGRSGYDAISGQLVGHR